MSFAMRTPTATCRTASASITGATAPARLARPAVRAARLTVSRRAVLSVRAGAEALPTVSETKAAFISAYPKPIPAMFNTVLQEMIVMQHMTRYNAKYTYNSIQALGFVSVFDQIFDGYKWGDADAIFKAYIDALGEEPATYRSDMERLMKAAEGAGSVDALAAMPEVQAMAAKAAEGQLLHDRFLAIGLFRLLELGGLTDPEALKSLIASSGLDSEAVNRDLLTYKGLLSKLKASKELQKEFIEREQRKAAEREAEKAAKAAKEEVSETA